MSIPAAAVRIGIGADVLAKLEASGDIALLIEVEVERAAKLYGVSVGFLRGDWNLGESASREASALPHPAFRQDLFQPFGAHLRHRGDQALGVGMERRVED